MNPSPFEAAAVAPLPATAVAVTMDSAHGNGVSQNPKDLWSKAGKAVRGGVAVSSTLRTLRDMCADAYIDSSCLSPIKTIGEGAFAKVYLAWYTPNTGGNRYKVAVKQLRQELYNSEDGLQLFAQEVELMKKLQHKNIVKFIGAGQQAENFVVQEYVSGGTLKQLVTRQMLSNGGRVYTLVDALDICLQIARGLNYLHSARPMVIHRDLKLDNVLLNVLKMPTPGGGHFEAKLTDFGLSKCVEQELALLRSRSSTLQTPELRHSDILSRSVDFSGLVIIFIYDVHHYRLVQMPDVCGFNVPANCVTLGECSASASQELDVMWNKRLDSKFSASLKKLPSRTLRPRTQAHQAYAFTGKTGSLMYMAPEVYRDLPYSEKADVFSFGMIMYEVMQRYVMINAVAVQGTYAELEEYADRVANGYRPPLHDQWPVSISSVIQDCWSGDPSARPSMADVVQRLETAQASGDVVGLDQPEACGCRIC